MSDKIKAALQEDADAKTMLHRLKNSIRNADEDEGDEDEGDRDCVRCEGDGDKDEGDVLYATICHSSPQSLGPRVKSALGF